MVIHCTDGQVVGETQSTVFTLLQQGPVSALIILKNSGVNTLNYDFQQFVNGAWADIGTSGSDCYNTLRANEVLTLQIDSAYPQVRLLANASGGAFIDFSVTRFWNRIAGGALPIMAL
jgi:hypothetical protein